MTSLATPQRTHTAVAAEARDVVKVYGHGDTAVAALDGASLAITAGDFTAVMGPSGSGKSTLMHAMAGLDTADGGQVYLGGTDITRLGEKQRTLLRRQRIGFVFQSFNLVPSLTAAENIALPLMLEGRKPADIDAKVDELLGRLGLGSRRDLPPPNPRHKTTVRLREAAAASLSAARREGQ